MSRLAVLVERLSFTYAGRAAPTLRDVTFRLPAGSWTVLTGVTGCGKSTLLRALAGLIPHHTQGAMTGRVLLDGDDTRSFPPAALAQRVGLVLQSPDDQICSTQAAAEVAFGLENLQLPSDEIGHRVQEALDRFGLGDLAETPTQHLSGGQKQRLMLASVCAMRPRLLLLDEPLSQLDPLSAAELLALLAQLRGQGLTIVMAEHRLDDILPLADGLLTLAAGALTAHETAPQPARWLRVLDEASVAAPEVSQLALRAGRPATLRATDFAAERSAGGAAGPVPPVAAETASGPPTGALILRTQNLSLRYTGVERPVWSGVSLALFAGQRVALVGPNGGGKSTLLAVLAGLLEPTDGQIVCDDALAVATGVVFQNPDLMLFNDTVADELAYAPRQVCSPVETQRLVDHAAGCMSLTDLLAEPPLALSQGQRLRCAVAATLTQRPRLWLLDEPTTGQDLSQVQRVLSAVSRYVQGAEAPACALFSTHDLRAVGQFADRVLVLGEGRLLADVSPAELLDQDALLSAARLRRPPLYELRKRLGLRGLTVEALAEELGR